MIDLYKFKAPERPNKHPQLATLNWLYRRGETRPVNAFAAEFGSHTITHWQANLTEGQHFLSFSHDRGTDSMDLPVRYGFIASQDRVDIQNEWFSKYRPNLDKDSRAYIPPLAACYRIGSYYFGDYGKLEAVLGVIPAWDIDRLITDEQMEYLAAKGLPDNCRDALVLLEEYALENGVEHTRALVERMKAK